MSAHHRNIRPAPYYTAGGGIDEKFLAANLRWVLLPIDRITKI